MAWADFLGSYEESKYESTPNRRYIAYLGETASLLAEEIPRFIEEVDAKWPEYWRIDVSQSPLRKAQLLTEFMRVKTGEYSTESFSDLEKGDIPRHDFLNFLMAIGRKDKAARWASGIDEITRGEFVKSMAGWLGRWSDYTNNVYAIRQGMIKRDVYDLTDRVKYAPGLASAGMRTVADVEFESVYPDGKMGYRGLSMTCEETIKELVRNALKATYDVANPKISVRLAKEGYGSLPPAIREYMGGKHADARTAEYAVLSVEDNGCGMNDEDLQKALGGGYSKFKDTIGGSGSGLSFLRRLWNEEGIGHTIESTEGKGTRFTVYFKLEQDIKAREP